MSVREVEGRREEGGPKRVSESINFIISILRERGGRNGGGGEDETILSFGGIFLVNAVHQSFLVSRSHLSPIMRSS